MGMFDNFLNEDMTTDICCAAGHAVFDLQTKSLGSDMNSYHLIDKKLYRECPTERREVVRGKNGKRWMRHENELLFEKHTGAIEVHGFCGKCVSVFTRSDYTATFGDSPLEPHQLWVEMTLLFIDGKLRHVVADRSESRQQLREKLAKGGSALLADDDPQVLEYLKGGDDR